MSMKSKADPKGAGTSPNDTICEKKCTVVDKVIALEQMVLYLAEELNVDISELVASPSANIIRKK